MNRQPKESVWICTKDRIIHCCQRFGLNLLDNNQDEWRTNLRSNPGFTGEATTDFWESEPVVLAGRTCDRLTGLVEQIVAKSCPRFFL